MQQAVSQSGTDDNILLPPAETQLANTYSYMQHNTEQHTHKNGT